MTPLFSVVIPTFNRSDLLVSAVQSVLAQTEPDLEVVVSDNHSTDDTRDAIAEFHDSRVRYVAPPEHMVLPDSWEFARTNATGRLVMMLSDDDALVPVTLARFAAAHEEFDADFLFCTMAEYRDHSFPPEQSNTLEIPAYTGRTRLVDRDLYLTRLMAFHPKYNTHPSGYVFESRLADEIAERNTQRRFFQTLGVEYFAWPIAIVLARNVVNVDEPILVIGRTAKSWGTNMVLTNPGQAKIAHFLADAQTERRHTPLTNFTFNNLAIEGLLTAREAFPDELEPYSIDFAAFVRETRAELERRRAQNVDVSAELAELDAYVAQNPALAANPEGSSGARPPVPRFADRARRVPSRLRRSTVHPAQRALGDEEGFDDALGAALFLSERNS
jgi:hypothetical protein